MANSQEALELDSEPKEGNSVESKEAAEEHIGMYPVDSPYYGLEAGSIGEALHKELYQEPEMMMPEIYVREKRRLPATKNERILRFFEDQVYAHREKNGDWIKLKLEAESRSLNKEERKQLLRQTDYAEKFAWEAAKRKFGETIPESLAKNIEAYIGPQKDFRIRGAIVNQGMPEDSGLFARNKEVRIKNRIKQERFIKHYFHEGPQEKVIAEIRQARKEELMGEKEEPMEEAA